MTLRSSELLLVAAELAGSLPGRPLQKVVGAGPQALALGFPGAWVMLSVDRRFGRIHLVEGKPAGTGDTAAPFVMLLRKELVGLRFESVEAVAGERALALELARGDLRRRLLVFLYGAGPRLILVDGEGRLLGAFPPAASGQPAPRTALPPPRPAAPIGSAPGEAATGEAQARPPHQGADDAVARFPAPGTSAAIAARYQADEAAARVAASRAALVGEARRVLERLRRLEQALERDLARLEPAAARRRHADLLLAHLAEIPRGAAEVVLPDDFEDGAPVRIALDPAASARDNAQRLYRQHRRLARGRAAVEERLRATVAERERAERKLAAIEAAPASGLGGLALPERRRPSPRAAPGGPRRPAPALPYRAFRSATGAAILVGKGADKNDELTFRVARGNDLWLHARDVPGAHVVVPLAGRPVDEQTLLDAATLALWFSPARPDDSAGFAAVAGATSAPGPQQSVQADVTYALRKLVRKPRGAAPGRVSVAGGKTIRIRLEAERLHRLLRSQPSGASPGEPEPDEP